MEKNDKWLLVSCMQKSIRRGLTDLSVDYCQQLYEIEKSYLLYRLSIIALEDIGIANPEPVRKLLNTEIKLKNIEELGGLDFIFSIVKEFSQGAKDRTAADISHLASFKRMQNCFLNKNLIENKPINIEQLKTIYLDEENDLIERCLSLWLIAGTAKQIKHKHIIFEGDREVFREIVDSSKYKDFVISSLKIHREPHLFAIPLVEQMFLKESKINASCGTIIHQKNTPNFIYEGFLLPGVDKHTKDGSSATYFFYKKNPKCVIYLRKKGVPEDLILDILNHIIFRFEGHQVDKRLFYPTAVSIMKKNQQSDYLNEFGVSFSECSKLIEEQIELLNLSRKEVLSKKNIQYKNKM